MATRYADPSMKSLRPEGRPVDGEYPEGYDPERLVVSFILDGEPLHYEGGGIASWGDMQTAPVRGDVVDFSALGIDEHGCAWVRGRCWYAHNWMVVLLETAKSEEPQP